ncbi:hypothetical protein ACFIJ5_01295 [Haloimpatiens sp. FM7330]|uniref:hypothetical protein n=1 Tax=Haloimpatiens sp. FM7330 TaxID=3298610 RepID=UPI00362DFF74
MKGFVIEKNDEHYTENLSLHQIDTEINRKKEFNNVSIINPVNSNCICIINSINIGCANDEFKILVGEQVDEKLNKDKQGAFYIFCDKLHLMKDELLHISTIRKCNNSSIEILKKQFIILLPKGCIYIKTDNPIKNIKIRMNWVEEKIY